MARAKAPWDCLVIGAGAAGVGVGVALRHMGLKRFEILDRHGVGASFTRWPREMRFITPSFATNSIGMLDLNSIAVGTSPAYSLRVEHPTGVEYAAYLEGVVSHFELPVRVGVEVFEIRATSDGVLESLTNEGPLFSRNVVWAVGEFQYPRLHPFPGAEHCLHNSRIGSWTEVPGHEHIVIGGYESGCDAAAHLANLGRKVRVLERQSAWNTEESDPSVAISPFTHDRLTRLNEGSGRVELLDGVDVERVDRTPSGFAVVDRTGRRYLTKTPPILATGFVGGSRLLKGLFKSREDGYPTLDENDQSTMVPGLFLAGPAVRHDNHIFCLIYKFRQRFAVVARAIGRRLEIDPPALESYRPWGMFLDDLSCCGQECEC